MAIGAGIPETEPLEQPLLPASKEQFRPQLLHTQVVGRPCWTKLTLLKRKEDRALQSYWPGEVLAGEEPDGQVEVGGRGGGAGATVAEEPTCAKAGNPQASGEEREAQEVRGRVRGRARRRWVRCGIFPSRSSHPGRVVPAGVRCVFSSRHEAPGGRPKPSLFTSKSRALLSKCLLAARARAHSENSPASRHHCF